MLKGRVVVVVHTEQGDRRRQRRRLQPASGRRQVRRARAGAVHQGAGGHLAE